MIKLFSKELFYVLTGALIIFIAMELTWDRLVLSYININWMLIAWLINGILLLALKDKVQNNR